MNKRNLHIFTAYYPGSKYEVYLDNEMEFLKPEFQNITFYPLFKHDEVRKLAGNSSIVYTNESDSGFLSKIFLMYRFIDVIFKLLFIEICTRGLLNVIRNRSFLYNYLIKQLNNYSFLRKKLRKNKYDRYYSNWSVDWSLTLAMLKDEGIIDSFVIRSHRYDLYDEEYPIGFIPFRHYQQMHVSIIAAISQDGCDYIQQKFPEVSEKVKLCRLGSPDHGINPSEKSDIIRIVSCSNIKKVKRIHLIVEALRDCKNKIEWNHFGEGNLSEEIEKMLPALPENIQVKFHGRILAEELFEFYRSKPVSLFLNVSASEGIPVSIMEAVSFGIPVVATAVGGTPEIINSKTGILLDADFKVSDLTEIIDSFYSSEWSKIETKGMVRKFWSDNYSAEKCFPEFVNLLSGYESIDSTKLVK